MTLRPLLRTRSWLAALALSILAGSTMANPEYSEEGAKACIDCHETPSVMGILKTAHAKVEDPNTPAAQKECQSCHGPSANHILFPMQVSNVHFGEGSKASSEVQNQLCLECHQSGEREEWHASAHGFEKVVCSNCHSMHDPEKVVPTKATVTQGCTTDACHGKLMAEAKTADFTHAIGRELKGNGKVTCDDCHNPHGPLSSSRCVDCHARTPDIAAKESPKAKRFHEVAERKGTECIRCHKGIAHPIPPLALQQSQDEMKNLVGE
jgi:nitrate/TMAO reductase-like tetraheme cytochrome c subunit